jgi:hypothetical protein
MKIRPFYPPLQAARIVFPAGAGDLWPFGLGIALGRLRFRAVRRPPRRLIGKNRSWAVRSRATRSRLSDLQFVAAIPSMGQL